MTAATVSDVQRFSLHDGPGIRTTVFLKGCPLRCAWCHNPETVDPRPELMVDPRRCLACGQCAPACAPGRAGPLDRAGHPGDACRRCGSCAEACPAGARTLVGRAVTVDALLDELARDGAFHAATGGGVTFSGGEPLTRRHAPFVRACLARLADDGVPAAVDTCGHVEPDDLLAAAALTDLVLYDLKLVDPDRHARATGRGNARILDNLARLLAAGHRVRVRIPLVPGVNDGTDDLAAVADLLRRQPAVPPVDLLPHHRAGRGKDARLGRAPALPPIPAMTAERAAACAAVLADRGLDVRVEG